jgi:uncharacterized protein YjeT (DUF2065 family)
MKWFLYLVSFAAIGGGAWIILYTDDCRRILGKFFERVSEKIYAAIAVAIGVLLIVSASASKNFGFVVFLGGLCVIDGIASFVNPNQIYQRFMDWLLNSASDQTYRFFGIIKLIVGTALFSWI